MLEEDKDVKMNEETQEDSVETKQKRRFLIDEPKDSENAKSNPLGLIAIIALFVILWFVASPKVYVVLLGLIFSIFLHELGHFMTARWTGMKATQFFIFMGPKIWSFKRGETEYGVRSLPLGAYVRIVGMNNLDPYPPEEADRAYENKSYPRRLLVITAGSMMHFLQAIIILVVLFSVVGLSRPDVDGDWSVKAVGGVSQDAGIEPGDKILMVDDVQASNFEDMKDYVSAHPGETVRVEHSRNGDLMTTDVKLSENPEGEGRLCLQPEYPTYRERFGIHQGFGAFANVATGTVLGLGQAPRAYAQAVSKIGETGEVSVAPLANDCAGMSDEAGRPISAVGFVRFAGGLETWDEVALMLAAFNIVLGMFNLVPLLPLDGGHAAIATYERLRSRKNKRYRVDANKLVPLTYAVIFLMIALTIPIFILDIFRPIVNG